MYETEESMADDAEAAAPPPAAPSPREQYVYMAKLAVKAERWDDMLEFMENIVVIADEGGDALTPKERNLLSVAYNNAVATRRSSLRAISSAIEQLETEAADRRFPAVTDYLDKIKSELSFVCGGILTLLKLYLIIDNNSTATDHESRVFYLKMRGDYNRYLAEITTGSEKDDAVQSAQIAYDEAQAIAKSKLAPRNLIRLGLALSICIFYDEIKQYPFVARILAKQELEKANEDLDYVEEENSMEVNSMIKLLGEMLNCGYGRRHICF